VQSVRAETADEMLTTAFPLTRVVCTPLDHTHGGMAVDVCPTSDPPPPVPLPADSRTQTLVLISSGLDRMLRLTASYAVTHAPGRTPVHPTAATHKGPTGFTLRRSVASWAGVAPRTRLARCGNPTFGENGCRPCTMHVHRSPGACTRCSLAPSPDVHTNPGSPRHHW
jgi:hypothetical protein